MSELQAVLLCGGTGSRMTVLTTYMPKTLLPVAGVPMFWYPLNAIAKTGVKDVKIIINEQHQAQYEALLAKPFFQWDHMKTELLTLDVCDYGTADALRMFRSKFTKDLIIVSGDFVSDAPISPLIDMFRCRDATLCAFLSEHCITGAVPGPKVKRAKDRDLIALSRSSNHLAYLTSEEDFELGTIGDAWINRFPDLAFSAKYNDCHIYVVRNWVLNEIQNKKSWSSFKAEVIPFLLEKQCLLDENDVVSCYAYLQPRESASTTAHCNTIGAYFEISRSFDRISPRLHRGREYEHDNPTKSYDSRVAPTAEIKLSAIDDNVKISERSRIQGSVIMSGTEIGRNAHISMSIIFPGVSIGDGAQIINSIVVTGQKVPPNTKVQNETLEEPADDTEWHAAD